MLPSLPTNENPVIVYVSSSGNDQNSGLNVNNPVASLSKALDIFHQNYNRSYLSIRIKSGDTVEVNNFFVNRGMVTFAGWNFETDTIAQRDEYATINFTSSSAMRSHGFYFNFQHINFTGNSMYIYANTIIEFSKFEKIYIFGLAYILGSTITSMQIVGTLINHNSSITLSNPSFGLYVSDSPLTNLPTNVHGFAPNE